MNDSLGAGTAWECSLELCEKSFGVINVTQGVVSASAPTERPLIIQNLSTSIAPTKPGLKMEDVFTALAFTNSTAPTYWIHYYDYGFIRIYLNTLLTVGRWDNEAFQTTREIDNTTDEYVFEPSLGALDIDASLAEADSIPHLFKIVAANMTESIRSQGAKDWDDVVDLHPGIAYRTQAYVHIRWGYLALPYILGAISAFILARAIASTEPFGTPARKSSSVALLFHRLAGYDQDDRVPTRESELESIASTMRGRLSDDEWPPAFVKED